MKLVDVIIATPSMLLPHNPQDYPNVKVVAVAGEPCPKCKYEVVLFMHLHIVILYLSRSC